MRHSQTEKSTGLKATKWNARLHIRAADKRLGNRRLSIEGFQDALPFLPCELKNKCDIYQYIEWVNKVYCGISALSDACVARLSE